MLSFNVLLCTVNQSHVKSGVVSKFLIIALFYIVKFVFKKWMVYKNFQAFCQNAIEMNGPSRYYTLEYSHDLYHHTNGCCIGSIFGTNKLQYDLFLQIIGIYTCAQSARVKINSKVCDSLFLFQTLYLGMFHLLRWGTKGTASVLD